MTDYLRTIMKQYANSPIMSELLARFDEWCDLSKFTGEFLFNIWDISTATGYGLDVWGRILGQNRYLQIQQVPGNNFGFDINDAIGTQWQPFSQAPFFNGAAGGTTAFALQDDAYRQLLMVKAAANIASTDVPSINALMRAMFGHRGPSYVGYDPNMPMHIGYHFDFFPTPVERSIIESGLFPQPAGSTVRYLYKTLSYAPFGFAGMNAGANPEYVTGWNQSPFYNP